MAKIKIYITASVLTFVVALFGSVFAAKQQQRRLKTVADIKPPRRIPGCEKYDESKAKPVTYAHTQRAALIAARPWTPRPQEPRGSFDCPCAPGV